MPQNSLQVLNLSDGTNKMGLKRRPIKSTHFGLLLNIDWTALQSNIVGLPGPD